MQKINNLIGQNNVHISDNFNGYSANKYQSNMKPARKYYAFEFTLT